MSPVFSHAPSLAFSAVLLGGNPSVRCPSWVLFLCLRLRMLAWRRVVERVFCPSSPSPSWTHSSLAFPARPLCFALKTLGALVAVSLLPLAQAGYRPLPPCLSDYQPVVQAGCFDNSRDGAKPALTERMDIKIYNIPTENCVDTCKGRPGSGLCVVWGGGIPVDDPWH